MLIYTSCICRNNHQRDSSTRQPCGLTKIKVGLILSFVLGPIDIVLAPFLRSIRQVRISLRNVRVPNLRTVNNWKSLEAKEKQDSLICIKTKFSELQR